MVFHRSLSARRLAALLPLAALLLGLSRAANDDTPSDVIHLTNDNFADFVKPGVHFLVEFYAPWCSHCKRLAPVWEEAAAKLKGVMSFGKVDATQDKALAASFGVQGYPTIKFIRNGDTAKAKDYKSGRSIEQILEFSRLVTGPLVTSVSRADLDGLLTSPTVTVAFISTGPVHEVFTALANKYLDSLKFVSSSDPEVIEYFQLTPAQLPVVLVIKDKGFDIYDGPLTMEPLAAWVDANRFPLLPELDEGNYNDVTNAGKPTVMAIVDPFERENTAAYQDIVRKMARIMKPHFSFGWLNGIKWAQFVSQFGVHPEKLPQLVVLNAKTNTYYFDQNLHDEDCIRNFLDEVIAGHIKGVRTKSSIRDTIFSIVMTVREWASQYLMVYTAVCGVLIAVLLYFISAAPAESAASKPRPFKLAEDVPPKPDTSPAKHHIDPKKDD